MIGWVDATAGASGDMLLGALVGAGVPVAVLQDAVDAVTPEPVTLRGEEVFRCGLAAVRVHVDAPVSHVPRTWADVAALLRSGSLEAAVLDRAMTVFARLATAEGAVHGRPAEEVHFHEVGSLDSIADVVGVCAGLVHLGLERLVVSPVAVGSGRVRGAHGSLPVPPPAVAELLRGVPSMAGPGAQESCTPTGAALLTSAASAFAAQPAMTVATIGVGAGGRDPGTHANVVRLLTGEGPTGDIVETAWLLETNVDDFDPRLWPSVIVDLLTAGAQDAWLTPILMKKGRPAHTLSALAGPEHRDAVRDTIFASTSTLGLRESPVTKTALDREMREIEVRGRRVGVKIARRSGRVVNVQPEFDDVETAARALGLPVSAVLAEAITAAHRHHDL